MHSSHFEMANQLLNGRLAFELSRRRDRGETYDDIMVWLRTRGVKVSRNTVLAWCRAISEVDAQVG